MSLYERHIPLQKSLCFMLLRWKLKKMLGFECASRSSQLNVMKMCQKCCVTPASRAQPHVTEAKLALNSGAGFYPEIWMQVPILYRTSMYMEEWVHILPSWFGFTEILTLKMETVAMGWAGRGAQQSCASGFTAQWVLNLEFWNFGNMFLNSFTTYNLYIKKMKKYLKIWLGGRPYSLNIWVEFRRFDH